MFDEVDVREDVVFEPDDPLPAAALPEDVLPDVALPEDVLPDVEADGVLPDVELPDAVLEDGGCPAVPLCPLDIEPDGGVPLAPGVDGVPVV